MYYGCSITMNLRKGMSYQNIFELKEIREPTVSQGEVTLIKMFLTRFSFQQQIFHTTLQQNNSDIPMFHSWAKPIVNSV